MQNILLGENDSNQRVLEIMTGKTKILLAASGGGHLTEGIALFGDLPMCELYILSEYGKRLSSLPYKHYGHRCAKSSCITMMYAFFQAFRLILQIRPDWVVTTGAECGTSAVIAAKILCRKTIFVETASRYRTKTWSARICYHLVDHFYVQWEDALSVYGEKAEYIGGIL